MKCAPFQVGQGWSPISANEIIEACRLLEFNSEFLNLLELGISVKGCGRPSQKLNAAETQRLKSFYEKIEDV